MRPYLPILGLVCGLHGAALTAPAQTPPADPPQADIQAVRILESVAASYRDARVLSDRVAIEIETKIDDKSIRDTQRAELVIAANGDGLVRWAGLNYVARGGTVFVWRDDFPQKYASFAREGTLLATIAKRGVNTMLPHAALISGRTVEDYLQAFDLGLSLGQQLVGHTVVREGRSRVHLALESENRAKSTVVVDEDTRLIESFEFSSRSGSMRIAMSMHPVLLDDMPPEAAFDPSGRQEVASVEQLRAGVGDPAPGFALETLDGTTVRLADARGSLVVLDFWATWCGPCLKGLPVLNEFVGWARSSGYQVKVYGINAFERLPTWEENLDNVRRVWEAQNLRFPTLLDKDDSVARSFGVSGIPHRVVIRPNGTIHSVHVGLADDMLSVLKSETRELFSGREAR